MFDTFYINAIEEESTTIRSFYLKTKNESKLKSYFPGQFITVKLPINEEETITRNYTISDQPNETHFRLTIKREAQGKSSRYFHDTLMVGNEIEVSEPLGNFHLDTNSERPVVLISGGVGITPMLSMLEYMTTHQPNRKVTFIHSSLDNNVRPFKNRLTELEHQNNSLDVSIFHTHPLGNEKKGIDYNFEGYVTQEELAKTTSIAADYFLCGPVGFMEVMYDHLIALDIDKQTIYYEFFGEGKTLGEQPLFTDSKTTNYKVTFTQSDKEVDWTDEANSLLDLAEANGINPPSSCRMGTCSTCMTPLTEGKTEYEPEPFMEAEEGNIFICVAKPTSDIKIPL